MKANMKQAITLAHEIKDITGEVEPYAIREAVSMLSPCLMSEGLDDVTLSLGGSEWRFIREDHIDQTMQDELADDTYLLGCFHADFLARILDIDLDVIEAMQKAEAFDALGKLILSLGKLEQLKSEYADADGYGPHFAHYDSETHELTSQPYYSFKLG
jgi:hypothetical protein